MKYYRLNYVRGSIPGFILVFKPSLAEYAKIKAYYDEFRTELEKIESNYWLDSMCFPRFEWHYDCLLGLLGVECVASELYPEDRHHFFVSSGVRGDVAKLSNLQYLLGYVETEVEASDGYSSAQVELSLISTMQALRWSSIDWVCATFSLDDVQAMLSLHLDQISGKETVSEEQRQKDIAKVERLKISQSTIIDQNRQKAIGSLMLRTGVAAVHVNQLKRQADERSNSQEANGPGDQR